MTDDDASLEAQAARAVAGDEEALQAVLRAVQDPIYGLCLRMLGRVEDARDATQEILIRILTRLSSFRGDSRLQTWAYRVAANYLLDLKRRPAEAITFESVDALLGRPANDIDPASAAHAAPELLVEEVFLGCTLGMLRCLDRDHRLAFILGAILELDGNEGAAILDCTPPAFRKRLSRARERLEAFMGPRCGVMSDDATCRCAHQVNVNVERGLVDPRCLVLSAHDRSQARAHIHDVRGVIGLLEVFHRHPHYRAPDSVVSGLKSLLRSGKLPSFH